MITSIQFISLLSCLVLSATVTSPAISVTTVELSSPFYLNQTTIITMTVRNAANTSTLAIGLSVQFNWSTVRGPLNSTFSTEVNVNLPPLSDTPLSIGIKVPSGILLGPIQYRLIILTGIGNIIDQWRQNVVRDYYLDAYASLRSSIIDRLTGKHYDSPEANALATEATAQFQEAESKYRWTEDGYNRLLKVNSLIDQAEQAEARYIAQRQDNGITIVFGIVAVIMILGAVQVLHQHRASKRMGPSRGSRVKRSHYSLGQ